MRLRNGFLLLTIAVSLSAIAAEARADAASCAALGSRAIAAAQIGLPSGGARIASARLVAATPALPEHCAVVGAIAPVDPAAPPINFQVNLPTTWNGKAVTDPDLSAFLARGGRLILKENLSDYAQSPYAGIAYYNAVVARMGQGAADRFIRFYTTPGANHGGRIVNGRDGAAMPDRVDLLAALDAWVERDAAPGTLTLSAHAA